MQPAASGPSKVSLVCLHSPASKNHILLYKYCIGLLIQTIFFFTSTVRQPYQVLMIWCLICFSRPQLLIYHPNQEKQGSPFPSLYLNKLLASFYFSSAAPAQSCTNSAEECLFVLGYISIQKWKPDMNYIYLSLRLQ